jgi:parallel beta-helix repeat protein
MSKKTFMATIINTAFLISLLASGMIGIQPTAAQSQTVSGVVTINSDGSVSPQTTLIQAIGSTYTLTGDFNSRVQFFLQKSNMIFDGNGHTIGDGNVGNIVIGPYGSVTNVTVQNFFVNQSFTDAIDIENSNNIVVANNTLLGGHSLLEQINGVFIKNSSSVTIIGNSIKNAACGIDLFGSKDNIIAGNIVYAQTGWSWGHYSSAIMIDLVYNDYDTASTGSSGNVIYDNAFLSTGNYTEIHGDSSNRWDNGKIGNYWGDYLAKYHNAVEVASSGIGNTPYVINENNIDHYPLMSQTGIITPVPTPEATPTPTPSPQPSASINASLSESASALNFGNTINFTVSVEGGRAPFTYAWYIDSRLVENSTSPYYATDSQAAGSHHVYVEVEDADNNTAKTLSPEFNVLPSLTYMPSSSASPTQQPTLEPSPTASPTPVAESSNLGLVLEIVVVIVIVAIVIVGLLVYFGKRRG